MHERGGVPQLDKIPPNLPLLFNKLGLQEYPSKNSISSGQMVPNQGRIQQGGAPPGSPMTMAQAQERQYT